MASADDGLVGNGCSPLGSHPHWTPERGFPMHAQRCCQWAGELPCPGRGALCGCAAALGGAGHVPCDPVQEGCSWGFMVLSS